MSEVHLQPHNPSTLTLNPQTQGVGLAVPLDGRALCQHPPVIRAERHASVAWRQARTARGIHGSLALIPVEVWWVGGGDRIHPESAQQRCWRWLVGNKIPISLELSFRAPRMRQLETSAHRSWDS